MKTELGPITVQLLTECGDMMDEVGIKPGETDFIGPFLVTLGVALKQIEEESGSDYTKMVFDIYKDLFIRTFNGMFCNRRS